MLKQIYPEVIDAWIDSEARVSGELESLRAETEATRKVLLATLRQMSPHQQLAIYVELTGSPNDYECGVGHITYTTSEEDK